MAHTYLRHLREELNELPCVPTPDSYRSLLNILDNVMSELARLDDQVQGVAESARMAANTASCLANGIRPD